MRSATTPTLTPARRWNAVWPQALRLVGFSVAAAAAAVGVTELALNPSGSEFVDLVVLLSVSAAVSLVALVVTHRLVQGRPLAGFAGRVNIVPLFASALMLANVLITAGFMFLSGHDLALLAVLLSFALVMSSVLAISVSRSITKPIVELVGAMEGVEASPLRRRADETGTDEIGQLGRAFNAMVDRLDEAAREQERAEHSRQELTAAISHDLRTPIASARLRVEALRDRILDESTQDQYLASIESDLDRLNRLIEDLFEVARIESGDLKLERTLTSLDVSAAESVEGVRALAEERAVTLTAAVSSDLPRIHVDAWCLERALCNLLENAVRHSPAGGTVALEVTAEGNAIAFAIQDEGPGVPAALADQIFEPFFRGDAARGRGSGGAGLGLAIARGLVEAHGGALQLVPRRGGAKFLVSLPR
jgi:signal transduction histidine kinase